MRTLQPRHCSGEDKGQRSESKCRSGRGPLKSRETYKKGILKLDATGEADGRAAGQGQTLGGGSVWSQMQAAGCRPVVLPAP